MKAIVHTTATREVCKACHAINAVGFSVPGDVWMAVVPPHLRNGVLCLACFARFGDERLIAWDESIELYPLSLATHQGVAGLGELGFQRNTEHKRPASCRCGCDITQCNTS